MLLSLVDDVLYFGVLLSFLVRWAVSRFPYSGAGKPPMYGDYEAQRHWMEITVNLPVKEWYKNSTENDMQYWGLDYPPLTAYQSLIFGYIAKAINPDWVALLSSRGYESYHHKIFMRATVIIADLLVFYFPVILYWHTVSRPVKLRDKAIAASLTLLYPGLVLVDHGHFQYNCVSLGFALWGIVLLIRGSNLYGAFFFTLALHYKQMSLYYALPFFCYLLGLCLQYPFRLRIIKIFELGAVVILTSALCWLPFLTDMESSAQVLKRLFPLDRGLYEDKVANVWCSLSVLIKLKEMFSPSSLATISGIATLVAVLPSSIHLVKHPTLHYFRLALVNSSLAFFLFSFQVHEKSILLVALPVMLLLEEYPLSSTWFVCISTFSLIPLLAKDGLIIAVFATTVLFLVGVFRAYGNLGLSLTKSETLIKTSAFFLSLLGCVLLAVGMFTIKQPARYPHIHILLNSMYSCVHFICFALYFNKLQITEAPMKVFQSKVKFH